ncbi:MAG: hypothetical protein Q8N89_02370 [Azonexus sp.]|nr:hypothetical protein [Azonexus sp.]
MRALLKFSVLVDHTDEKTPIYADVLLYREINGLVWRVDGELGDECEELPKPKNVEQAMKDAKNRFPKAFQ